MAYQLQQHAFPSEALVSYTSLNRSPLTSSLSSSAVDLQFLSLDAYKVSHKAASASQPPGRQLYQMAPGMEQHSHDPRFGGQISQLGAAEMQVVSQALAAPSLNQMRPQEPARAGSVLLQCKWEGCGYTGQFNRTSDLLRHIRQLHLTPGEYRCPVNGHCKPFNRKDNLLSHIRRVHGQ